jgi:desulfoferrodoxin (superoxide reductase-like protein)
LCDRIQEADWKKENHVPAIESLDDIKDGLGKEIAHFKSTAHPI